ncbi:hypothetical protein GOP47_0012156 [Adiantum capillus-veneris]|uniref:Uncharacterized protein n=1 Tax=Adiantum capillus-veneris TaxID=13818 RepID=A0A9D4UQH1_ADICA|nr:hypothetical protein GOP47_0012156 [Adiantum capillus-veneris]
MCNSAEQAGVDQANESSKDNGFTSESDLLFICANTPDGNGNIGKNSNDMHSSDQSSSVNDSCCHKDLGTRPRMSEHSCTMRFADLKHFSFNATTEAGMMDTLPTDKEVMPKPVGLEIEIDVIDRMKLKKEDMQETRGDETADSIVSSAISDGNFGQTPEDSEMPVLNLEAGGQQFASKAIEEAATDVYNGAKQLEIQARMQQFDDTELDHSSIAESVGKFECHSTCPPTDPEQKMSTLKYDVSSSQEVNTQNMELLSGAREYVTCIDERQSTTKEMTDDKPAMISPKDTITGNMQFSNTCQDSDISTITCIAARSQAGSGNLTRRMASGSEELAVEHCQERLKQASQDPSIEIEQQEVKVGPQIVHTLNIKGNIGPELADFFSNARDLKHEVEIEEHEHVPIKIKSPPKRKSYKESPRSLRMLLFSDETASFTKKEEKYKRDGRGMEFSNKIVPAFEGIGDESRNEDINLPKWHEIADNVETSTCFSGQLAFSGALTYQGLISYSGQVAYSGNISHRSDSSTSTRSFAFPILASEWSASPVKIGAPDPRFFRQEKKWHLCSCCKRPSTLFD